MFWYDSEISCYEKKREEKEKKGTSSELCLLNILSSLIIHLYNIISEMFKYMHSRCSGFANVIYENLKLWNFMSGCSENTFGRTCPRL